MWKAQLSVLSSSSLKQVIRIRARTLSLFRRLILLKGRKLPEKLLFIQDICMPLYRHWALGLGLIASSLLLACQAGGPKVRPHEGERPVSTVSPEFPSRINFEAKAGRREQPVANLRGSWSVSSDQHWCTVELRGSTLVVSVTANEELDVRTATLRAVSSQLGTYTLRVQQLGSEPAILLDADSLLVPATGGPVAIGITTNVPVTLSVPEWMSPQARAMRHEVHEYTAAENKGEEDRHATVTIRQSARSVRSRQAPLVRQMKIRQAAYRYYAAVGVDSLPDDFLIPVDHGHASASQSGLGIELSYDGDYTNHYHSPWNNSGSGALPVTLTYYFSKLEEIDYLIYYPRTDATNGHFQEVDLLTSTDGENFSPLMTKDFKGSARPTQVAFDKPLKAQAVRFVVRSGTSHNGRGFAAVGEMTFYRRNPAKAFDPQSLFADVLCTKLRPEVTMRQIEACPLVFFRELARAIYQGTYDPAFRVAAFRPYLDPGVRQRENKMNPHSILDNPTGIAVSEGEELIVFVEGEDPSHTLRLRVQDIDQGFGGTEYPLEPGMNRLKIRKAGLCYVLYHAQSMEQLNAMRPIRMHFASGKVNGYYDSQNPRLAGRWQELLGKATEKQFDVLGKWTHMTFPTDSFRKYVPDGRALTSVYDSIVYNEWVLHGLYKYNRLPPNRMYLMSAGGKIHMYATHFRTVYNLYTLRSILNRDVLMSKEGYGGVWGQAHEIGHMNQTRPGLVWKGMNEVTVNIPSLYVSTYVFGAGSRLQIESLGRERNNRYTLAFSSIIAPELPFAQEKDVFRQLVPFWQLELYFGRVLGRTPRRSADGFSGFYPDLYEYLRTHPDPAGDGALQTEFAYIASRIGGMNLTRFFERWGFLRPATTPFEVTEARIQEVRRRIDALHGRSSEGIALEYITDHNADLYVHRPAIQAGGAAVRSGRQITVTGWRNVVAYEVVDAAGKLVFVADASFPTAEKAVFTLLQDWRMGYSLRAVSAGNERRAVPVN